MCISSVGVSDCIVPVVLVAYKGIWSCSIYILQAGWHHQADLPCKAQALETRTSIEYVVQTWFGRMNSLVLFSKSLGQLTWYEQNATVLDVGQMILGLMKLVLTVLQYSLIHIFFLTILQFGKPRLLLRLLYSWGFCMTNQSQSPRSNTLIRPLVAALEIGQDVMHIKLIFRQSRRFLNLALGQAMGGWG